MGSQGLEPLDVQPARFIVVRVTAGWRGLSYTQKLVATVGFAPTTFWL